MSGWRKALDEEEVEGKIAAGYELSPPQNPGLWFLTSLKFRFMSSSKLFDEVTWLPRSC